eukprot:TRINITY_DN3841_c0_g1_i1.p1 TRINITY_DN3841_c0_g1~~TRINITY_DN3841_c0_g1_i1.p1  ORF type:complete len:236 (-),score=39.37 TRINITY_DN3841_c0_g1_i1:139-846(-)
MESASLRQQLALAAIDSARIHKTQEELNQLSMENASLRQQLALAAIDSARIHKTQEEVNQLSIENASLRQRFADSDTWVKAAREQIDILARDNRNLREQRSIADAALDASLNRSGRLPGTNLKDELAQPWTRKNNSPRRYEAESTEESGDDCLELRFDRLIIDETNHDALKQDLLCALLSLGLPAGEILELDVRLCEGSGVAELRGSADLLQQLSLLPLSSLQLQGCPARQVFAF